MLQVLWWLPVVHKVKPNLAWHMRPFTPCPYSSSPLDISQIGQLSHASTTLHAVVSLPYTILTQLCKVYLESSKNFYWCVHHVLRRLFDWLCLNKQQLFTLCFPLKCVSFLMPGTIPYLSLYFYYSEVTSFIIRFNKCLPN